MRKTRDTRKSLGLPFPEPFDLPPVFWTDDPDRYVEQSEFVGKGVRKLGRRFESDKPFALFRTGNTAYFVDAQTGEDYPIYEVRIESTEPEDPYDYDAP